MLQPVICGPGYSPTSSGTCLYTQIDFNNCGSIGHVCTSNCTSCLSGKCSTRPAVQLAGAIAISEWLNMHIDDVSVQVNLSVNITLYNYTTNNVFVTSSGVLCLGNCSAPYINVFLPSTSFDGPTVFCFWDDLEIFSDTGEGVYYNVSGTAPDRITTFEYYEAAYNASEQFYHFQMIFYENLPNIVKCLYFETSNGGASATIGVQLSSTGPSITYSVNQANAVTYNKTIIFSTNNGTFIG